MVAKHLIIFILFYFFAVLQNSFFVHFNLFGAVPNLVFILFCLVVFYEDKKSYIQLIAYSILAGLLLDFYLQTYFGTSIVLLLVLGFCIKKSTLMLQERRDDKFPIIYFLPLFIVSLMVYDLAVGSTGGLIAKIIYNLVAGAVAFYLYKKFISANVEDRQLKLFRK